MNLPGRPKIRRALVLAAFGALGATACNPAPVGPSGVTARSEGSVLWLTMTTARSLQVRCTGDRITANGVQTASSCSGTGTVRVTGSAGPDTIDVALTSRRVQMAVDGAAGNDRITVNYAHGSDVTVTGGTGNDQLVDASGTPGSASRGSLNVDGGPGRDTFATGTGNVTDYGFDTADAAPTFSTRTRFVTVQASGAGESASIVASPTAGPEVTVSAASTWSLALPRSTENLSLDLAAGDDSLTLSGRGSAEIWAYGGAGTNRVSVLPGGTYVHAVDPGPIDVLNQAGFGTWYAQQFATVTVSPS